MKWRENPGCVLMVKVILVRHGQTEWNYTKRYMGHSDIPLDGVGLKQAQAVAARLAAENITAIYSSDLRRAVVTAEAIAKPHGLAVNKLPGVREIHFGLWEGLTYAEIIRQWPDELTAIYAHSGDVTIPGGESFSIVQGRAVKAVKQCLVGREEETVVFVAHGGVLRVLLCDALGLNLDNMWNFRQDSACMDIIEYYGDKAVVSLVNA